MLKRYAPADIVIWKEWLVYAIVLGVADKVAKAMEELNTPQPPEAFVPLVAGYYMHATLTTLSAKTGRGGNAGGGFGGGEGFGGGAGTLSYYDGVAPSSFCPPKKLCGKPTCGRCRVCFSPVFCGLQSHIPPNSNYCYSDA